MAVVVLCDVGIVVCCWSSHGCACIYFNEVTKSSVKKKKKKAKEVVGATAALIF